MDFPEVREDGSALPDLKRKGSFIAALSGAYRTMPSIRFDSDRRPSKCHERLWELMGKYLSTDISTIQQSIVNHVEYTLARTRFNCDTSVFYRATAYSLRDRLIESFNDTNSYFHDRDVRRCYYLSLEFLLGRVMQNALVNMEIETQYRESLEHLGFDLEALLEHERDPALGNGGLGRLAACFLDSMATLNFPCWGYGIRYTYGIFEQKILAGRQVEHPDYWLVNANPWEIERSDCTYAVRFFGKVKESVDPVSKKRLYKWVEGEIVQAVAYDNPIPGYETVNAINLRLWRAYPSKEFDFHLFNVGKYLEAVRDRQCAEYITAVLYPNDNTWEGKELRLKQQYFFACATIQDILRRFKKRKRDWEELPEKVCLQLNDTHPAIAIPEFMRLLVDIEGVEWNLAWNITRKCFNYTNHTVLPEALEKWPVSLLESLLPRHLLIINDINFQFLNEVRAKIGDDWESIRAMSIYEEGWEKKIKMANLAVIGSTTVNGVARLHTELVKRDLFPAFTRYYNLIGQSDKFTNITNGVTPRRWVHIANRELSKLFTATLGSNSWIKEFRMIEGLLSHSDDKAFHAKWRAVKNSCKERLINWVKTNCGVQLEVDMLFDIQVKRIHEYKRQLMNCLYIIHRYLDIKKRRREDRSHIVPRACLIGGKAAPGYHAAKSIIKLCNSIAEVINNDPDVHGYLSVVFLPNYNVSNAQVIIPASDISQHISTAGTEASGTSNMKFVMNGGLIIGTLDGANVEILEDCGPNVMFLFGAKEKEVDSIRQKIRNGHHPIDGRLQEVFDWIRNGNLARGDLSAQNDFSKLINQLCLKGYDQCGDYYLIVNDFSDYCRAQAAVDVAYKDTYWWTKVSIESAALMSKFSSDRTVTSYAEKIWHLVPQSRPPPTLSIDEYHHLSN